MFQKKIKTTVLFMWVTALFLALFFVFRIQNRMTDGFHPSGVKFLVPQKYQVSPKKSFPDGIVSQSFIYLGKGSQSFVFQSEDGNYVIKFFKKKHLFPSYSLQLLSKVPFFDSYCTGKIEQRQLALKRVVNGYALASGERSHECGVLYAHLDQTWLSDEPLEIFDKKGNVYHIDLNDYFFVLQKRAVNTKTELLTLLNQGNVNLAKKRIRQVFDHYLAEYADGVFDEDYGILSNKGFVSDKVILIDAGKLTASKDIKNKSVFKSHLAGNISRLKEWLSRQFPHYADELDKEIETKWSQL